MGACLKNISPNIVFFDTEPGGAGAAMRRDGTHCGFMRGFSSLRFVVVCKKKQMINPNTEKRKGMIFSFFFLRNK
jgi:hypothetical protein